jgi:hypothetical protein
MKHDSYSDPTVSSLVDQAFNLQLQLTHFKSQVDALSDTFLGLYQAYDGLHSLHLFSNVSLNDCRPILCALNQSFSSVIDQLHQLVEDASEFERSESVASPAVSDLLSDSIA